MMLQETYTLSNGVEIPKLGLGTWLIEGDAAEQAVKDAAKLGYRHIDTAQDYGNEAEVAAGIKACGVPARTCSSPPSWRPGSRTTKAP